MLIILLVPQVQTLALHVRRKKTTNLRPRIFNSQVIMTWMRAEFMTTMQ